MICVPTLLGPVAVDDQGTPEQPTILLWPSLFTDHTMWRHQIQPLHDAGWRTLAIDPPGHGHSTGPGRHFTMDESAQVILDILDALDIHRPVVLAGASWGGFVAPRVVATAPERVAGMVLFNTSADDPSDAERKRPRLLTRLLKLRILDRTTGPMIVSGLISQATKAREPQLGKDLARTMLGWDRSRFVDTVSSVLVERDGTMELLPGIAQPVLVVSGSQDRTLPTSHAQRLAALLPHGRHIEIEGAAHLAPLEAPEQANTLLLDFLHDIPATTAQ